MDLLEDLDDEFDLAQQFGLFASDNLIASGDELHSSSSTSPTPSPVLPTQPILLPTTSMTSPTTATTTEARRKRGRPSKQELLRRQEQQQQQQHRQGGRDAEPTSSDAYDEGAAEEVNPRKRTERDSDNDNEDDNDNVNDNSNNSNSNSNNSSNNSNVNYNDDDLEDFGESATLSRDVLLSISSADFERFVERLSRRRGGLSEGDMKEVRRQRRLIKNRESAALSRNRKKQAMETLEAENSRLRMELDQQKHQWQAAQSFLERSGQLADFMAQLSRPLGASPRSVVSAGALFAVFFSVAFLWAAPSLFQRVTGPSLVTSGRPQQHHSLHDDLSNLRKLLSMEDGTIRNDLVSVAVLQMSLRKHLMLDFGINATLSPVCVCV